MHKAFEKRIDTFAQFLQKKNNLDRIAYLKIKLGLEVFFNNLFKTIVIYGLALLFHVFLYTLTIHLSYFVIRHFAHGAHAKSTFACYIESIILFVILPWVVVNYNIPSILITLLAAAAFLTICIFAPAATHKQPIPSHMRKRKKIKAIISSVILLLISFMLHDPFNELIQFGVILIGGAQLPLFFPTIRKDGS